jgi:hypothetical protein
MSDFDERKLQDWMKSGAYLPDFMRDFHDQKDLFKTIHELVNKNDGTQRINWIDAHIYTVDVFLWFMARRGYTLQRSRAKQSFLDVRETVEIQTKRRDEAAMEVLKAVLTPQEKA